MLQSFPGGTASSTLARTRCAASMDGRQGSMGGCRVSRPAVLPAGSAGQVGDQQGVAPAVSGLEQGELGTGVGHSRRAKIRIEAG